MRGLKYILKWLAFETTHLLVGAICLISKLGLGKQLCREFKASMVLGAGGGAYIRGNYEKAYEILAPYQNVDDDFVHGGVKYQLALLFYYGRGVAMNRPVANTLFEEAASLGWDDAQKYLSQFNGPYSTRT
ncbi:hypothetical protein [Candidatus Thiodiazotropha endoloripes]|uniref:Sel1 repeat family protein n=1 Tax=Candidatus Thiodiazotropha endoloripes TaxID=1818881 RepID=A0A1E2UML0_9GAMM|nr:hypothetical protein [Candidatus Thiodiazotropha endoloripes]ODB95941.1 hypothetical protein A3196_03715 [Candidatus Thiodiazotropha endoloripes]